MRTTFLIGLLLALSACSTPPGNGASNSAGNSNPASQQNKEEAPPAPVAVTPVVTAVTPPAPPAPAAAHEEGSTPISPTTHPKRSAKVSPKAAPKAPETVEAPPPVPSVEVVADKRSSADFAPVPAGPRRRTMTDDEPFNRN